MRKIDATIHSKDEVLHHTTTLKIFLYFRSKQDEEFGIRETQRIVGVKSPSTISWHLEKLETVGLVNKLPSNRYILSNEGKKYNEIQIPTMISAQFIKGFLVPKFTVLLFILFFAIAFTIVLWVWKVDPLIIGLYGSLCLLGTFLLILNEWIKFQINFNQFFNLNE